MFSKEQLKRNISSHFSLPSSDLKAVYNLTLAFGPTSEKGGLNRIIKIEFYIQIFKKGCMDRKNGNNK